MIFVPIVSALGLGAGAYGLYKTLSKGDSPNNGPKLTPAELDTLRSQVCVRMPRGEFAFKADTAALLAARLPNLIYKTTDDPHVVEVLSNTSGNPIAPDASALGWAKAVNGSQSVLAMITMASNAGKTILLRAVAPGLESQFADQNGMYAVLLYQGTLDKRLAPPGVPPADVQKDNALPQGPVEQIRDELSAHPDLAERVILLLQEGKDPDAMESFAAELEGDGFMRSPALLRKRAAELRAAMPKTPATPATPPPPTPAKTEPVKPIVIPGTNGQTINPEVPADFKDLADLPPSVKQDDGSFRQHETVDTGTPVTKFPAAAFVETHDTGTLGNLKVYSQPNGSRVGAFGHQHVIMVIGKPSPSSDTYFYPVRGVNVDNGSVIDGWSDASYIEVHPEAALPVFVTGAAPTSLTSGVKMTAAQKQNADAQAWLRQLGFLGKDGKPLTVDGNFGTNSKFALAAFQKSKGISGDGTLNQSTYSELGIASGALSGPSAFFAGYR